MAINRKLVIIDPQNSFCKPIPQSDQQLLHDGELCIDGAWDDMERLANLIVDLGDNLSDIKVTLDSHQRMHIAHPDWFCDALGNQPAPFTFMRAVNDVIMGSILETNPNGQSTFKELGEFETIKPEMFQKTYDYLIQLKDNNRYPHCLWPPHCQIGTSGHNIVTPLYNALDSWCSEYGRTLDILHKGENPWAEHFSAVRAEVVDPNDAKSHLNTVFILSLMEADEILFSGQARSHCVANTVRDIANEFINNGSLGQNDEFIKKCTLLTDTTSDVQGFEDLGNAFIEEMVARGMKTTTCTELIEAL